jgi:hypothetical protein
MLRILIHNDLSGTEESANYDVDVLVNAKLIATHRVEGHNRKDGWVKLLKQLVKVAEEEG